MTNHAIQELIERLPGAFLPEKAAGVDATVQFNLSGPEGGDWYLTIQDQKCTVSPGQAANPRLIFEASAQDCLDILTGKLDAMRAYMQGKLRLKGDLNTAMKLTGYFSVQKMGS
jgi:putative sterol carrier protein